MVIIIKQINLIFKRIDESDKMLKGAFEVYLQNKNNDNIGLEESEKDLKETIHLILN